MAKTIVCIEAIQQCVGKLDELMKHAPAKMRDWIALLRQMENAVGSLRQSVDAIDNVPIPALADLRYWVFRLSELLQQRLDEAGHFENGALGDQPFATATLEAVDRLVELPDDAAPASEPTLSLRTQTLIERLSALADDMDFRFLYNAERHLFAVGYNLSLGRLDSAHYDLLASEASLTSFYVIARGEIRKSHWFQLGRPLTRVGSSPCLLSWGGTMFEYLMPRLFLRVWPQTLLDETHSRAAVQCKWTMAENAARRGESPNRRSASSTAN